ncbi:hypothetical protein COHA_003799 [Chlorella ohadii]|uniref:Uncharacterized protein n=1 Tax=Chlorella ohadii TaxID=2649997 RepID=A0AAD5DRT9_9CHLO|nr:hypothetical protein COHA_003799 [Chlorella ohadii]
MRRTLAVLLALLLALDAPCACAAKQLGYAVLLSEGPDKPNAAGQTVAWGSYHITITGYLPCQGGYSSCDKPGKPHSCPSVTQMVKLAGQAWKIANGGKETYNLHGTWLSSKPWGKGKGKAYVAELPPSKTLDTLADELCKRGFSSVKGPHYTGTRHTPWHISLGTAVKLFAKARFNKHAKEGSAPPLHLWIVPCYTDAVCAVSKKGCPCGAYIPKTHKLKPADQQWRLVKPQ